MSCEISFAHSFCIHGLPRAAQSGCTQMIEDIEVSWRHVSCALIRAQLGHPALIDHMQMIGRPGSKVLGPLSAGDGDEPVVLPFCSGDDRMRVEEDGRELF